MSLATLPDCQVLCTFGSPEPDLYEALIDWLDEKQERTLLVLDEKKEMARIDDRVYWCQLGNEEEVAKKLVFLSVGYLPHPGNSEKSEEEMAASFAKLSYLIEKNQLIASDFQNQGLTQLDNFFKNASFAGQSVEGTDLFGKFQGVPALICGAGPSLEIDAEQVAALKDHALLFAGGTALSSLAMMGITPHFAGAIDPHSPQERHFLHKAHHLPIFYQNRTNPDRLKEWEGKGVWIPGGLNDLFEKVHFDGGWNVSTFLAAIAYEMGCNPIILVGVDLAQSKDKSYASDLPRTEGGDLVQVPGTEFYSRTDWLFARDWLTEHARSRPDRQWIQTSKGGLDIGGFERKDLEEIKLPKIKHLERQINDALEKCRPKGKGAYSKEELIPSYCRVEELCNQLLELSEQIFPDPPHKKGEYTILQVEMEAEVVYRKHLLPIWNIWEPILARQIPKDVPPGYGIELNRLLFIKEICHAARAL